MERGEKLMDLLWSTANWRSIVRSRFISGHCGEFVRAFRLRRRRKRKNLVGCGDGRRYDDESRSANISLSLVTLDSLGE